MEKYPQPAPLIAPSSRATIRPASGTRSPGHQVPRSPGTQVSGPVVGPSGRRAPQAPGATETRRAPGPPAGLARPRRRARRGTWRERAPSSSSRPRPACHSSRSGSAPCRGTTGRTRATDQVTRAAPIVPRGRPEPSVTPRRAKPATRAPSSGTTGTHGSGMPQEPCRARVASSGQKRQLETAQIWPSASAARTALEGFAGLPTRAAGAVPRARSSVGATRQGGVGRFLAPKGAGVGVV